MSSGVGPQPAPSNRETKTQEGVRLGALFTQLFSINQRQGRGSGGSGDREGFVWGKKRTEGRGRHLFRGAFEDTSCLDKPGWPGLFFT